MEPPPQGRGRSSPGTAGPGPPGLRYCPALQPSPGPRGAPAIQGGPGTPHSHTSSSAQEARWPAMARFPPLSPQLREGTQQLWVLHGAAWNMAGIGDTVLAVGGSGGAAGPDGPQQERDHGGMVEQVSGRCQAKVGVSWGPVTPLIASQKATSRGSRGRDHGLAPRC
ncbi:hypothetical protein QTO34_008095 [Cnephaeus nilssonii]|uniref:Uncharacterized protein n=1 Tax=Cnephaeus nilssonii TaxID=3371016 RepID=A0AA40LVW4_CNENI|nr:hypothetical protein QTO34_008095 [Eptesicus nilssonii]